MYKIQDREVALWIFRLPSITSAEPPGPRQDPHPTDFHNGFSGKFSARILIEF